MCDNGLHPAADGSTIHDVRIAFDGARTDEETKDIQLCSPCLTALGDNDWETLARLRKGNGKVQARKATGARKAKGTRKKPGANTEALNLAVAEPAPAEAPEEAESRPTPPLPEF